MRTSGGLATMLCCVAYCSLPPTCCQLKMRTCISVVTLPRFSSHSSLAFSSGLMAGSIGQIISEFAAWALAASRETKNNRARIINFLL